MANRHPVECGCGDPECVVARTNALLDKRTNDWRTSDILDAQMCLEDLLTHVATQLQRNELIGRATRVYGHEN